MSAPRLNRALVLEEAARLPDGAGGYRQTWAAVGTLWAAVEAGTGGEREGETARLASLALKITVRAAAQGSDLRPRPEQRFRDGTRIFRILAVAEADADRRYLTCFAREEVIA